MSFNIEFQLQPDNPKPGEQMSLYANLTYFEDTRCDEYELDFTFTYPSGHVHHDRTRCEGADPHSQRWHALLESFDPGQVGKYHVEVTVIVDSAIKAQGHYSFEIQ